MAVGSTIHQNLRWLNDLKGWLSADLYSSAWVAMVPDKDDPDRPAWPETIDHLLDNQLPDGGWGDPHVYYAHERTITTLAALRALHTWHSSYGDHVRIERGLKALHKYAADLQHEPHEPVAFELLLPTLSNTLIPFYGAQMPLALWEPIEEKSRQKLALISKGSQLNPTEPRAWWFSLELLSPHQLANLDDSILEDNGSVASSVAATAAYLLARRWHGHDSPRAAEYLGQAIEIGGGSVPFSWPAEVFELVWVLDTLRRAGFRADELPIDDLLDNLEQAWYEGEEGLSSSRYFRVNDGDDTLVGYSLLEWAGREPSDEACWRFWDSDHFRSYLDERTSSVSANIHALGAFRPRHGHPNRPQIEALVSWLRGQIGEDGTIDDKWHLSPYYSVAHAIPALAGWDDETAVLCLDYLVRSQRADGGWGYFEGSTLEETGHCILGLFQAYRHGLLSDLHVLSAAERYLNDPGHVRPVESFWIGKTLFRPDLIVEATLFAARHALAQLDLPIDVAALARSAADQTVHLSSNGASPPARPSVNGSHLLKTDHSLFRLSYHLYLKPKHGRLIQGEIACHIERTIFNIAEEYQWHVDELEVTPTHTHVFLTIPPKHSLEDAVQILKTLTQREVFGAFPSLEERHWAGELWTDSSLIVSHGTGPSKCELDAFFENGRD